MLPVRFRLLLALALSLGVHVSLLALVKFHAPPSEVQEPLRVDLTLAAQPVNRPRPARTPLRVEKKPARVPKVLPPPAPEKAPEKAPATMAAPPAPTAEEWALASTYTLKNSKRYRYAWGQQVRSMMGTAVEGERQGLVRFRVEIAPDGTLAKADVLWSTSDAAEKLALQAIRAMPPLPPTPTGKPLVFEKTIAFVPFETGWPPVYKYDCQPDPPSFSNRFAWNGSSPPPAPPTAQDAAPAPRESTPSAECPGAAPDSIEAEEKDMERQFKEWGSLGK